MESTQELRHWGIKGQRWGVRRYQNPDGSLTEAGKKRYYYQNPDGSLTEAGKKDYMKAAKKGKLDVSKLSDNDLNMINSRFAREKTFKQNVSDYEKSTFKYRLKEAALARIKGSGGGGGGGKGKGGGSGIAKMLAMPIKKALTDAFTEPKGGKGKNKGGDDEDEERREARDYKRWKKHGRRFTDHFVSDLKDEQVSKALRNEDVDRGRFYLGHKKGKMSVDDSVGRLGVTDATRNGTDYMQRRLEERRAAREAAKDPALKAQRREENRQRQEAAARRKERELEERMKKSGLILGHNAFVVRRDSSDELYHWGIKGQKWGIRRFENPDGTLTEEGKARYHSKDSQKKLAKDVKKAVDSSNPLYNSHAKKVVNSPQVKDALAKVKDLNDAVKKASQEYTQMESDWYNRKNPKMYDKYTRKYAEESSKKYGDGTKEDIENRLWPIRNDDLDNYDSFRMYLDDNPKEKAKHDAAYKKYNDAIQKEQAAVKRYASEWLGDYGNEQIKARQNKWNNYSYTVSDRLASMMSLKLTGFYKW